MKSLALVLVIIPVLLATPLLAVDRIPARTDFVGHVPSLKKLKLQEMVDALPKQKEEARKKLKGLEEALGLKSIDEIAEIWLLVDKGSTRAENKVLLQARVDLDPAKLKDSLAKLGIPVQDDKVAGFGVLKLGRAKAVLCVPAKGQVLLGHPEMVESFLSTTPKQKGDLLAKPAVAALFGSMNPEAFAQLLLTGYEPQAKSRWGWRTRRGPIAQKIHDTLTGGLEFEAALVQLLDDKFSLELHYTRESKLEKIRGELSFTDPKIRIGALIDLIIEQLPNVR